MQHFQNVYNPDFKFLILICHYSKCLYKCHLFLKFEVLREGCSFVASFVEHPVCSNFKTYSVLILFKKKKLALINLKNICKNQFFMKFQVLCETSSVVTSFLEHPVYSFFQNSERPDSISVILPIDTGRKLKVHKTFRRHHERSIYVLCLPG